MDQGQIMEIGARTMWVSWAPSRLPGNAPRAIAASHDHSSGSPERASSVETMAYCG